MVEILKVKCLCEKVYVSPICSASSFLLERDFSNSTATLLDKIKFKDGHFQGRALKDRVLPSYLIKNSRPCHACQVIKCEYQIGHP